MIFKETGFNDLWEIHPSIFKDKRGYFLESYRKEEFEEKGIPEFVQDNQSFSSKGVLRGLHFQRAPHEQGKLVSVISGTVLDIVVDIRPDSPTLGDHYKCVLQGELRNMLYVPPGFAHGFLALEDSLFSYKCSGYYHRPSEMGIKWDDPELRINWNHGVAPIVSEKDAYLPGFQEIMAMLK